MMMDDLIKRLSAGEIGLLRTMPADEAVPLHGAQKTDAFGLAAWGLVVRRDPDTLLETWKLTSSGKCTRRELIGRPT
jgi:hypothetical protein